MKTKLKRLQDILRCYQKVAVAYSSGVDSTFLLKVAVDTLGKEGVIALTAVSPWFPKRETKETESFCKDLGIKQQKITLEETLIPGFTENPVNRCYLCKKVLFQQFIVAAEKESISVLIEGSNVDDEGDYRPGLKAIKELDIKSPLREAGLTKAEIRMLSKEMGLSTYQKPSFACLASRFPYGETITEEKLKMVELAEQFLLEQGFSQFRVRIHGEKDFVARIEVPQEEMEMLLVQSRREKIQWALSGYGFAYIALDLKGYRTGSMNENIRK